MRTTRDSIETIEKKKQKSKIMIYEWVLILMNMLPYH